MGELFLHFAEVATHQIEDFLAGQIFDGSQARFSTAPTLTEIGRSTQKESKPRNNSSSHKSRLKGRRMRIAYCPNLISIIAQRHSGRDPSPVPRRLVKASAAVHPLPAERASRHETSLLPGEKVADGGGRMRGYLLTPAR